MPQTTNINKCAFTKGLRALELRDKEQKSRFCAKFCKELRTELGISRQYFHAMKNGEKPKEGLPIDRIEYIERKFKEYGVSEPWGVA